MRHVLLILPFLLDGLLADVVAEHNRNYPLRPVYDPSKELIEITMLFIQWYMLYRRRFPPKDEVDVKDMVALGEQYVKVLHIEHILHVVDYIAYLTYSVDCLQVSRTMSDCLPIQE